jgi:predicted dehydrogenase
VAGSYDELLAEADLDCVIVCTPTPHHVDMAARALDAGRHVMIEKPVALDSAGVEQLVAHHERTPELVCMPAHVIRFWPGWTCIKEAVRDGWYGRVLSATFRRLGTTPGWNRDFYSDLKSSGGALVDLHIHDVDFIIDCFGVPDEVQAAGDLMHVTGVYGYADGPRHVVAEAAWDQQAGFGFRMRCVVNFERATMEFDSLRDPPLVVIQGENATSVVESRGDGYAEELRGFLEAVGGVGTVPVTLGDALRAARLIDRERAILLRAMEDG